MSLRRIGGILVALGIASILLQLVGLQLMLFWFLDEGGPTLAYILKGCIAVGGFVLWRKASY